MADSRFVTDGRTDGRRDRRCHFNMPPEVPSGHKKVKLQRMTIYRLIRMQCILCPANVMGNAKQAHDVFLYNVALTISNHFFLSC